MPKMRAFISFDFSHDHDKKESLVKQAKEQASPFTFVDSSLIEGEPETKWVSAAQRQIGVCDLFIVILGENTHSAPGVKREIGVAKGLGKKRFQLRAKGRDYHSFPEAEAGPVVVWKWKNLAKWFAAGGK